ncbi:MAG: hypothetical protein IT363_07100 [Methanoregulaceae archaeon]|nr:hypothetical protein [Methanoregulaceae archaeon]
MTLLLACLAFSQSTTPLSFEYMIRGGVTDIVNGQFYISAGLLEPLGYRVQFADGKTVRAAGYGGHINLPVRSVTASPHSANRSSLVPLGLLSPFVKKGMRLSQGHEYATHASGKRPDLPPSFLWEQSLTYNSESLRHRRWFKVANKTIPGMKVPIQIIGLTVGLDGSLKSSGTLYGYPRNFVSAQLIVRYNRQRLPKTYSEQTLPLEAFTLRTGDGGTFQSRSLVVTREVKLGQGMPLGFSVPLTVEVNADKELGTAVPFWIPPDRSPTELVYCDGRTLLRAKLVEFDGPSKSLDPVGLGQDTLTVDNKTFRYEQVFK